MSQTTVDSSPETPEVNQDETVKITKLGVAIQDILNQFADLVADRTASRVVDLVMARLSSMGTAAATPVVEVTPSEPITDVVGEADVVGEEPTPEPTIVEPIVTEPIVTPPVSSNGKRTLSPEARARISASQKARWANRPRQLSDAAKHKIAESQRKRWAEKRGIPIVEPTEPQVALEGDTTTPATKPTIPTEAVLAEREGYKGDRFYIAFDGHYIGDDGFVVPKNFDEFTERYPKYIETWVRRRLSGKGIEEDIEDWRQDLIIHMKYLPEKSKHRASGKSDVIETFDPFAQYGASERRWRNYVNYCLTNKYNTIHGKRTKNPVCRAGNVSLVSDTSPELHGEVTDEYVYSNSAYMTDAASREESKAENRMFTHKFVKFVQDSAPEVFPVLEAIYVAGGSTDAIKEFCQTCKRLATTKELSDGEHEGHSVGMPPREFNQTRNRLKQLAMQFMRKRSQEHKPLVKSS